MVIDVVKKCSVNCIVWLLLMYRGCSMCQGRVTVNESKPAVIVVAYLSNRLQKRPSQWSFQAAERCLLFHLSHEALYYSAEFY